jgi:hypothetical protein
MELVLEKGTVIYSPADHDRISQYTWFIDKNSSYVYSTSKCTNIRLHRFVLNAPDNIPVDHINGNRLDNRQENLRLTNSLENAQNRKKSSNKTSEYMGVSYNNQSKKYRAAITINSRRIVVGSYNNEKDAAEARDLAIVNEFPNSSYNLNFPENMDSYELMYYKLQPKYKKPDTELVVKSFYENTVQC